MTEWTDVHSLEQTGVILGIGLAQMNFMGLKEEGDLIGEEQGRKGPGRKRHYGVCKGIRSTNIRGRRDTVWRCNGSCRRVGSTVGLS